MKKSNITKTLENMKVGETVEFDILSISAVRNSASLLGLKLVRKYSTEADRERRIIAVTRVD